jgi:UDP-N-acetyl-D-mannosaminuronic acid dehydrogenase
VAMKVVVVGIGYVGLPLAVMLARTGLNVVGVDKAHEVVSAVNSGMLPVAEDEIREIFSEKAVQENLRAQTEVEPADAFIISVPTPIDERKRVADLSAVTDAMERILPHLRVGNLIIIESTVPPLTCRRVIRPLIENRTGYAVGREVHVCHCPERILPGNVFHEVVHNDRIIGGMDPRAASMAADLYATFVKGTLLVTDDVTAELVKLMENTSRDVNIALANEFAAVAEGLGVDPLKAIALANRHPRVQILSPGIGTGGHCICVDPWFIKEVDPVNSRLILTAREVNERLPERIAARIRRQVRELTDPKVIAIGAAYKPNTYDVRNSPAIRIVEMLREDGYRVENYDPLVRGMEYGSLVEVCRDKDCLVILVEHDVVRRDIAAQEAAIREVMRNPSILRFYPSDDALGGVG